MDSQLLLWDQETGVLKALMDANYITAMRTGAVTAHSALLFAKQKFSTIGIIGLGITARTFFIFLQLCSLTKNYM